MTRLAYSRLLTPRFQTIHLVANYSLLTLACIAYLLFDLPSWVPSASAAPGAFIFLVSIWVLSYRKTIEGGNPLDLLNRFM